MGGQSDRGLEYSISCFSQSFGSPYDTSSGIFQQSDLKYDSLIPMKLKLKQVGELQPLMTFPGYGSLARREKRKHILPFPPGPDDPTYISYRPGLYSIPAVKA